MKDRQHYKNMTLYIKGKDVGLYQAAEEEAEERGISLSELIAVALSELIRFPRGRGPRK